MRGEPCVEFVEGLEQSFRGAFVCPLGGGEAGAINAIVHALVNALVDLVDFSTEIGWIEIVSAGREIVELAVEHPQKVVVRVADDAVRLLVPEDRNGDAPAVIGIGRVVGFA